MQEHAFLVRLKLPILSLHPDITLPLATYKVSANSVYCSGWAFFTCTAKDCEDMPTTASHTGQTLGSGFVFLTCIGQEILIGE